MTSAITINDEMIRRQYDDQNKKWYFSVVDVVAIVTDSSDPRNYWKVLKSRLNKANPELVTKCNQLKMPSSDGKSYLTDTADSEVMLQIISAISKDFVHPFRLFFEKTELIYPHVSGDFLKELENSEELELPVDMYQTPTEIIIESLIAGSQLEDIFISIGYKNILIKGRRTIPQNKENYLYQEIYWGTFSRSISLPSEIQIDLVEASSSHGFLKIRLPKIDTLRTRIVKVKPLQ